MRRCTAAIALVVATSGLTACSWGSGATYPDATDLDRAVRVWQDPWAAPTIVGTAAPTSGPDAAERLVGTRLTSWGTTDLTAALAAEVAGGTGAGWTLHAVDCTAGTAYLVAGLADGRPSDLDIVRSALVQARADGEGTTVTVEVLVPHHRDGSWPAPPPALDPTATCLAGKAASATTGVPAGSPTGVPTGVPTAGPFLAPPGEDRDILGGDGAEGDPDVERPEWPSSDASDATRALVADVAADGWVAGLDAPLELPRSSDRDWRRDAPQVTLVLTGIAGATASERLLTVLADVATAGDGWEATYVACDPSDPTAPAAASLRRTAAAGTATLTLTALGASADVRADVVLPVDGWATGEAYVAGLADLPVVDPATCGGVAPVREGVPAVLPMRLWPATS
ncbi:hypothetical protein QE364_000850 [Nocardioides zeae]|uniref:Uncharacterized protein n=1 Tax=Nocardioides zeae TaxID=1457234 RepID=A0ACC6IEW6_9ACTN|nr:hypothetical protein [Nocardioides zeae]MDR6174353.1 hypothetical protein [Nocardioides zeae]MDR6209158.1 hypothetical protein [Nocardioides zeae]